MKREAIIRMSRLGRLLVSLAPCLVATLVNAQEPVQQTRRQVIDRPDQLPTRTYDGPGTAGFMKADGAWLALLQNLRKDLSSDLVSYDIRSGGVRWQLHSLLFQIDVLIGNYDDAVAHIDGMVAAESKKGLKLYHGLLTRSLVAAARAGPERAHAAFRATLETEIAKQPFSSLKSPIQLDLHYFIIYTDSARTAAAAAQRFRNTSALVSNAEAQRLVSARFEVEQIQFRDEIIAAYSAALRSHASDHSDVFAARAITLPPADRLTPVTIAVWDGVDVSLFDGRLHVNTREVPNNGLDDDGNGFVDDVHGVAFDAEGAPGASLLSPSQLTREQVDSAVAFTVGQHDVRNAIASPAAATYQRWFRELSPKDRASLLANAEELVVWYGHGTQIADLALRGNPAARLLVARSSEWRRNNDSTFASPDHARRMAARWEQIVAYMKQQGVRVANLSWGFSAGELETELRKVAPQMADSSRSRRARELFDIYGQAITRAIASAPEILFVVTAGNQAIDTRVVERYPANLAFSNVLTVGGVDDSGEETNFTSFGKVDVYANAQDRSVLFPSGKRGFSSGGSLAAPDVVNLVGKLWALYPKASVADIRRAILNGAETTTADDGRTIRVLHPQRSLDVLERLLKDRPR